MVAVGAVIGKDVDVALRPAAGAILVGQPLRQRRHLAAALDGRHLDGMAEDLERLALPYVAGSREGAAVSDGG